MTATLALKGLRLDVNVEKLYSGEKTSGFRVFKGDASPFFLKVFHHRLTLKGVLSSFFLSTRPAREFKYSKLLRERGFPVPEVFAFHSRRLFGLFPVNIGYTKAVFLDGLIPLDKLTGDKNFSSYLKEAILLLARLHREGFIHKDASLSNFALYKGTVFLIDLEGISKVFLFSTKVKNLVDFLNDCLKYNIEFNLEVAVELYTENAGIKPRKERFLNKILKMVAERKR